MHSGKLLLTLSLLIFECFQKNIETNATVSVPSDVLNLTQISSKVSINRLMTAVGLQYLKTIGDETTINQGFNYVTPNEHTFPGK